MAEPAEFVRKMMRAQHLESRHFVSYISTLNYFLILMCYLTTMTIIIQMMFCSIIVVPPPVKMIRKQPKCSRESSSLNGRLVLACKIWKWNLEAMAAVCRHKGNIGRFFIIFECDISKILVVFCFESLDVDRWLSFPIAMWPVLAPLGRTLCWRGKWTVKWKSCFEENALIWKERFK